VNKKSNLAKSPKYRARSNLTTPFPAATLASYPPALLDPKLVEKGRRQVYESSKRVTEYILETGSHALKRV